MPHGPNTWWLVPWGNPVMRRETSIVTLINTALAMSLAPHHQALPAWWWGGKNIDSKAFTNF